MIYLPQINSLSNITGYKIKVESLIDLMNPAIYSALEHLSRQCNLTIESSDLMDSVKIKAALKIILPERCLITVHAGDIEACGVSLIEDINQKTRRLVYQEDASKEDYSALSFRAVSTSDLGTTIRHIRIAQSFSPDVFDLGFTLHEGWGFLNGETPPIQATQKTIINMINMLKSREDLSALEREVRKDPIVSAKLFGYINSPAFGLNVEIRSFSHALAMLGRSNITKWLCVLLASSSSHPHADAILRTSIVRASLMEKFAAPFVEKEEMDSVFITGSFSMLDKLFSESMQEILSGIAIPEEIKDSLLGQGRYTPFLDLSIGLERSQEDRFEFSDFSAIQMDPPKKAIELFNSLTYSQSL